MARGSSPDDILYGHLPISEHEIQKQRQQELLEARCGQFERDYDVYSENYDADCPSRAGDYSYIYELECKRTDVDNVTAVFVDSRFKSEDLAKEHIASREIEPGTGLLEDYANGDEHRTLVILKRQCIWQHSTYGPRKLTVYRLKKGADGQPEESKVVIIEPDVSDQVLTGYHIKEEDGMFIVESIDKELALMVLKKISA